MKACRSCNAWIPDAARFCPSCGAGAADAGPDSAEPPPVAAGPSTQGVPPPPPFDRARAAARVKGLGTLFIIAGALVIAVVALAFAQSASGGLQQQFQEAELKLEKDPLTTEESREVFRRFQELYLVPAYLALAYSVPFLLGALWIWAGVSLSALKGRTLALVAAVLMVILAPCKLPAIYTGCCCCFTVPLGIYALFVLTLAETELVLAGRGGE